jgi:pimeloyl-ACP methyl ester carboxylesterase
MDVFKSSKGRDLVYESYDRLLALWGVRPEERDVETAFGTTHLLIAGDSKNPPLLLLHGVGDNSAIMWIRNSKTLSDHFFCVAVDTLGGAGKSVPDAGYDTSFTLPEWFCGVLDAIPEIEGRKVNIAGVSYGCYQAQLYAMTCPGRVDKAVGIAGYPSAGGYNLGVIKRMLAMFFPQALFPTQKNMDVLLRKFAGPHFDTETIEDEVHRHFTLLIKKYNQGSQRHHKRVLFTEEQYDDARDRLLFLVGDCDSIAFFPEAQRAIKDLALSCKVYPKAGHMLNYQFAEQVNKDIVDFILG